MLWTSDFAKDMFNVEGLIIRDCVRLCTMRSPRESKFTPQEVWVIEDGESAMGNLVSEQLAIGVGDA